MVSRRFVSIFIKLQSTVQRVASAVQQQLNASRVSSFFMLVWYVHGWTKYACHGDEKDGHLRAFREARLSVFRRRRRRRRGGRELRRREILCTSCAVLSILFGRSVVLVINQLAGRMDWASSLSLTLSPPLPSLFISFLL